MEAYPRAAMERAMKVQDVMLQAMAKKITWWQAAEILGISDRHMRRWRERYVEEGYNGLLDRRRGKPSRRRVPLATVEKVFALYREKYFDLNVQHFHEKLQAEHRIELSYTWVKQALQGAGLVARGRKRGAHRKRRERRPLPGMLLHIDGSRHQWFQDERWYDLIVILDDATSEIYYAQLVEEESTATVMAGLQEVIERKGVFCALYSDRGSRGMFGKRLAEHFSLLESSSLVFGLKGNSQVALTRMQMPNGFPGPTPHIPPERAFSISVHLRRPDSIRAGERGLTDAFIVSPNGMPADSDIRYGIGAGGTRTSGFDSVHVYIPRSVINRFSDKNEQSAFATLERIRRGPGIGDG